MKHINCKTIHIILKTVLFSSLISTSSWATGPRISESLLSPNENQMYASDFPPFATTELATGGLNSEIIDAVLKISNIAAVQTVVPLPSMVKFHLIQDKALAIYGREPNFSKAVRESLIYIPISVSTDNYIYYKPAHKTELNWEGDLKSFKGLTYGAYKGENVERLKEHGIDVKTGRVHSLLKKMVSNKVDFMKMSDLNREWMLDKYFSDNKDKFLKIKKSRIESPLFIIFNKKHSNGSLLAKKFKAGIFEIVKNGQYQNILKKYIPDNVTREQNMKKFKEYMKKHK